MRKKHETFESLGYSELVMDRRFALADGVVKSGRGRGMYCGDIWFHGGFWMIRFWMLAILLIGMTSGVTEARGRHRVSNYQGGSWQSSSPMRYTTGTTQAAYSPAVYSQNGQSGSQQQIHPVSFVSTNDSSVVQGHSMQAWAEEEARLMASRGICGHVRPAPMGCFVGVGCGTTCMGSGRLVAEASYQGKTVRVWQR